MTCRPRKIIGNLPFNAIPKDFNRYCDRIIGNIIPGSGSDVTWLLTNVLNLLATFGDDAVKNAGSPTSVFVYDDILGKSMESVPAGVATTKGALRISYDTAEGATLGSELVVATFTERLPDAVFSGGILSLSYNNTNPYASTPIACVVGQTYQVRFSYDWLATPNQGRVIVAVNTGGGDAVLSETYYDAHQAFVFTASNTTMYLILQVVGFGVGESAEYSDISVARISPVFINNDSPIFMAVSGDSIAAGHNTSVSYEPPLYEAGTGNIDAEIMHRMTALTGGDVPYENHAKGAQTFAWVASTGGVSAIGTDAPAVLIHCGVNDISAGRTWAAVEADLDTINALLGAGQTLFIDEILPWTNGNDTQAATVRTFNANLAAWSTANSAVLIIVHDTMGQTRPSTGEIDDLKAEYDQDGVHVTQSGVDAMAQIWLDAIIAELGAVEGSTTVSLHPVKTGDSGENVYLVYQPWTNGATVPAGGVLTDFDGVHCKYYSSALGGTTSGTGVADDVGVTDWVEQGKYSNIQKTPSGDGFLPHVMSVPFPVTNYLLNSDAPATQTTGSLGTGDYNLSQDDAGSSDLTAGTATISAPGSATDGSDFQFTVTVAGTVTVTVVGGPPDRFQLNDGDYRPVYVPTAGSTVTRSADSFTSTEIPESGKMRWQLALENLDAQTPFSDGTNELTYTGTAIEFTDGVVTLSHIVTPEHGDFAGLNEETGEFYYNGILVDTDGTLAVIWGTITKINNVVQITDSAGLDLTDTTWSQP